MPFGPSGFRDIEKKIPNLIAAGIAGFERLASSLMKKTHREKGVAQIATPRDISSSRS